MGRGKAGRPAVERAAHQLRRARLDARHLENRDKPHALPKGVADEVAADLVGDAGDGHELLEHRHLLKVGVRERHLAGPPSRGCAGSSRPRGDVRDRESRVDPIELVVGHDDGREPGDVEARASAAWRWAWRARPVQPVCDVRYRPTTARTPPTATNMPAMARNPRRAIGVATGIGVAAGTGARSVDWTSAVTAVAGRGQQRPRQPHERSCAGNHGGSGGDRRFHEPGKRIALEKQQRHQPEANKAADAYSTLRRPSRPEEATDENSADEGPDLRARACRSPRREKPSGPWRRAAGGRSPSAPTAVRIDIPPISAATISPTPIAIAAAAIPHAAHETRLPICTGYAGRIAVGSEAANLTRRQYRPQSSMPEGTLDLCQTPRPDVRFRAARSSRYRRCRRTVAYGGSLPPPECRYDDVLTEHRAVGEWRMSLLDPIYMVTRGYVPEQPGVRLEREHRREWQGPKGRHPRPARNGRCGAKGGRRHQGHVRVSQLFRADARCTARRSERFGLRRSAARRLRDPATRSTSWAPRIDFTSARGGNPWDVQRLGQDRGRLVDEAQRLEVRLHHELPGREEEPRSATATSRGTTATSAASRPRTCATAV